jgi:histone acetyltransferase 1
VPVKYAEKVQSALNPADDVVAMLKKHLSDDGVFTDRAAFLAVLEADAAAPIPAGGGEIVAEWDAEEGGAAAAGAEDGGCKDTARVFRLSEEEVWKWHARFEPMTFFYIDGASALDSEDERWLLFAVIRTNPKTGAWRLLSFATVYEFFVYPASVGLYRCSIKFP